MKFVDEVRIRVRAGRGGDGVVAWRREKYVPQGGPAGGDGGDGGSVLIRASRDLSTLLDYKFQVEHRAESGEHGGKKDMYGKKGQSVTLRVPIGTLVYDETTDELLADLAHDGQELVAARGGKGGFGNIHFTTSTNRAPEQSTPGTNGEERDLRLELKLLADVGILGFPNVGKSTFISRVSQARPKIADYPFTTLTPNLGVVRWHDYKSMVIADIPGLIPGAHEGAGLGLRFLRHIERTKILLHILEWSDEPERNPIRDFEVLNRELALYSEELAQKQQIVAINKIDLPHVQDIFPLLEEHFQAQGIPLFGISAVSGKGIQPLLEQLGRVVFAKPEEQATHPQR